MTTQSILIAISFTISLTLIVLHFIQDRGLRNYRALADALSRALDEAIEREQAQIPLMKLANKRLEEGTQILNAQKTEIDNLKTRVRQLQECPQPTQSHDWEKISGELYAGLFDIMHAIRHHPELSIMFHNANTHSRASRIQQALSAYREAKGINKTY